ncbi:facilitated trehalose transporter Tret1-like [Rhopalosiphum maidis]|uniref:facilitated trehalose transporter Tret1-like n=1 Tax=Rhopalosiphum maidis TaxID=43146 RepID=UPI000EFE0B6F|nr:facilitated trehalose transporter Tret1-like [Rhopalosiphum maidis]XP_026820359.1 facilitated trehalose transporter Tret1-like [Rhopalosiphum maidis]XP_026820361.1 facilitated trehalose transporter Tret1-like [Rhopalosiphum maidis]XP_026820362.1 facilitated trehalose transporter Tret1-like [Rhopalosiphum maidis]XP_026820363.1 facilitated trehalose transporter Tret1-like [Rhopalosiphum maidis]
MSKKGVYRQIYVTIVATLSIFISGMWLGWPSSVVEKFIKHETDFNATMGELSWIVATMDLGNVISPLLAGHLMDWLGRKPSTAVLGPLFMITWALALWVPTAWALYTARLLAGMGKGMSYTVVPVYLGEIASPAIRGALGSVFCLQLHFGFLLEAIVGPLVSYRTLNAMSAVVPILFFVTVVWLPESPYYLLKRERRPEAAECLQWFRGGGDVDHELDRMAVNVRQEMENRATFRELFSSRKDMRALAIVVVACATQRAGGISCIMAYSALILPDDSPLLNKHQSVMLFAITLVVANFVAVGLVDRVGRKSLLFISEVGMGVVTLTFTVYFFCSRGSGGEWVVRELSWLPYLCHLLFAVMFAAGVGFVPVVFLGEMFPVNIRSHCSAIASITLAFCSFVTNKIFLFVSNNYGFYVMFTLFTVVNFSGAFYTYKYAIETKGKTLQEIQEQLQETVGPRREKSDPNDN